MPRQFPTMLVEIAFASKPDAASPVWTDVTSFVHDIVIKRGRKTELDRVAPGVCNVRLKNRDRRFEPEYAGALVNLLTNPSGETDAAGWAGYKATVARDTAQAKFGSASLKVTCSTAADFSAAQTASISGATAGRTYAASGYVYVPAGSNLIGRSFQFIVREQGGAAGAQDAVFTYTLVAGWQRVTGQKTVVQNDRTGIAPQFYVPAGALVGDFFYVDGAQVELASAASEYIDGSLDNGRWSGTAHASTSYRGGPYYPNVLPNKKLRVSATWAGQTYRLFTGYIEDWPQERIGRKGGVVPIVATDGFEALAADAIDVTRPQELSGARIAALLDAAGWPAADRTIDAGYSEVAAMTYANAEPLGSIQDVASSEFGVFFIAGDGKAVFQDRRYRSTYQASVQATFGDAGGSELPFKRLVPDYSRQHIRNTIRGSRTGGVEQIAIDESSRTDYRRRSHTHNTVLASDADQNAAVNYLLSKYKEPKRRVRELTIKPTMDEAGLFPQVLGRQISDRIRVLDTPQGGGSRRDQQVHIEGVEHRISVGSDKRSWLTVWDVAPADDTTYWLLGDATRGVLGTSTRLGW